MAAANPHEKFCAGLSEIEKTLLRLRDDIDMYNGSWDRMLQDLQARLNGRPYIFKLVHRIQDDIRRIEKLQAYEKKNRINLADYLKTREER